MSIFTKTEYVPVVHTRDRMVPYEKTVIEKRAPTDESIKIYDEMLEKAKGSLIDAFAINDNILNIKVGIFFEVIKGEYLCMYTLIINGNEISDRFSLDDYNGSNKMEFVEKLYKHACKHIAVMVAKELYIASVKNKDLFSGKIY